MAELPDRTLLLALAALMDVADGARDGPVRPTLTVRALLALVHARSNGDAGPYREFWRRIRTPSDGIAEEGYMRASYARTAWARIVRTLGIEPQSQELHEAVGQLVTAAREAADLDLRARRLLADAVRLSKYDREIVATKGHPHSEAGRRLMGERIVRGEEPAPG